MTIPCSSSEFALPDWSAHSIDVSRRAVEVSCLDGELLVTCEGDAHDHVVAAGAAFVAHRRGRLVIAALRPSRVEVRVRDGEVALTAAPPPLARFRVRPPHGLHAFLLLVLFEALLAAFLLATLPWGASTTAAPAAPFASHSTGGPAPLAARTEPSRRADRPR